MARILVVDDDMDIALLLRTVLEAGGHEVQTVERGARALALLESDGDADVVILDVQMPEVDGWETLERLRRGARAPDVPVLLCTVKSSTRDLARGWQLGCDGYVTKPFDIEAVLREVKRVLGRAPNERERVRESALAEAKGTRTGD